MTAMSRPLSCMAVGSAGCKGSPCAGGSARARALRRGADERGVRAGELTGREVLLAAVVGQRVVFALLALEALEALAPDRGGGGAEREVIRRGDRARAVERVAHGFGDPNVTGLV